MTLELVSDTVVPNDSRQSRTGRDCLLPAVKTMMFTASAMSARGNFHSDFYRLMQARGLAVHESPTIFEPRGIVASRSAAEMPPPSDQKLSECV
ncbi:hypothetical protein [Bradyrhizobium uaiense]|uniref:Uncharacterized protein n=1 Tax=Bradyrhizobium uaiense TaxID=2594946 RepID=A0A6P1BMZ5_9BRAD|nr:hypothetical protein [Bradyrhizobium uaiense]NEU99549.1 hypothetical protein [Bradyrhizobium uaiense]